MGVKAVGLVEAVKLLSILLPFAHKIRHKIRHASFQIGPPPIAMLVLFLDVCLYWGQAVRAAGVNKSRP